MNFTTKIHQVPKVKREIYLTIQKLLGAYSLRSSNLYQLIHLFVEMSFFSFGKLKELLSWKTLRDLKPLQSPVGGKKAKEKSLVDILSFILLKLIGHVLKLENN